MSVVLEVNEALPVMVHVDVEDDQLPPKSVVQVEELSTSLVELAA